MLLKPWVSVTFGTADIWSARLSVFDTQETTHAQQIPSFTLSDLFCCFLGVFFIYMMEIDSWTAHALNFGRILGSVFNQPTLNLLRIISRTFVNPPDVCKLFCSKLLESHTLHVCLCVCSLPHVRMHYRASRALVHLLAWVLTSLSSSNEHETRCDGRRTITMHYLTNGQVADALVLVLRPISQWAKTALFNHLIFSWVRSVMFTMIFLGILPAVNAASQRLMFKSLKSPTV